MGNGIGHRGRGIGPGTGLTALIDDDFRFGKNDALSYTNARPLSMLSVDETLSYG
jgi:hypothetical protein